MSVVLRKSYTLQVELPTDAFGHHPWVPEEISEELRVLWLIEQVRQRRLGYGKAAELAGVPKAVFIKMMGERRVSPVDYDHDELEEEFRAARELAHR